MPGEPQQLYHLVPMAMGGCCRVSQGGRAAKPCTCGRQFKSPLIFVCVCVVVLGLELTTLHMIGKYSTIDLHPRPFLGGGTESFYIA